jgi:ABC-2 type transport system ATP-binding protein
MTAPAILVEDLAKRFGEVEALCGVSLEVPAATVLGLLGPNGAGKTTAVRIMTTLLRPDGGRAQVLGIDVTEDPERVRASIGLAGQNAAIDENLTGRENLRLVGRLTHLDSDVISSRSDELLSRFELDHAADRLARTYSGGMRRRLDLAAALVHRPTVLFLDEPTTGLDPRSRTELWAVIEELVDGGTTVLLTTQYLEEADRLATRIVVIDHGTVIAEGTSSELKGRLGATVIEVGFAAHDVAQRAAGQLGALGSVTVDGPHLRLSVADGAEAMLATVRTLDGEQLQPVTMALREPTLDDVFLSLTGHGAEDGGDGDDDTGDGARARRSRRRSQ